jgi:hypothetical protein
MGVDRIADRPVVQQINRVGKSSKTAIKNKRNAVIKRTTVEYYNPDTFAPEPFFHIVEDPQIILDSIRPLEGKYICFDTETHPTILNSNAIPTGIVRRWVGSGNKAIPQDFPFCISLCDGTNCYTIFDSIENKYAKFKALKPLFEDDTIEKIAHNINSLVL